jgi:hypothetical protein
LAERVYADVAAPEMSDALSCVRSLLTAYYDKVVLYPALTLEIFARPAIFPDHARRITDELASLLGERNRPSRWTHILVDYTHGAALAVATRNASVDDQSATGAALSDFQSGLAVLLNAFERSSDYLSG